jgi:hypothetical protein
MASTIVHESLAQVLKRTAVALVADVATVGPLEQKGMWRELELSVMPVRMLFGTLDGKAKTMTCRYQEGVPHRRGSATVSPLVPGSGHELQVKPGDRVILLLADPVPNKPQTLLRIEPLTQLKSIPSRRPR